ncbi:aminotransferase class I/II-fold pyridoxal phosphate-dependent enzyme [Mucilaginibacter gossypii]|uniref:aminotransferase class I/II-fold pyridoxal phosphate-dependent enzyme n=1 Tax=Mucilaginibacter gossypii TaxID=551996 RepID=UPI000DCCE12A|nr:MULTISPECIES: aminotransferase class I/II-fold pyridoxal phosphate-dependent enzyme [Mucilaginibacter]QTE39758.1 aminotransferase class I/II-fold pyridoxal phosphate-dependent enzyme [Mucilaginibacter gossypii]RAV58367.1 hypothetical protein DIU36_10360 [Mucilaginibacter rubeus]
MKSTTTTQDYSRYVAEDHHTWATLSSRQKKLKDNQISEAYLDGLKVLQMDDQQIVRLDEVSERLEALSGWTLIPVTGLMPTKEFFCMLISKKYPITVSIRKPYEIDFSEQPDIYHDVCGHLPLLTNKKFIEFLTSYSIIALKYVNNEKALDILGRFYWFTYEMGIIRENGVSKPYGGAIITSAEEIENSNNPAVPKHEFDLDHIFRTTFDPYKLQKEYFVINSFDELFDSLEHIESKLIEYLLLPEQDLVLRNFALNPFIGKDFNNVIGFLNDIQFKFPKAISFVAGQPDERFFEIEDNISRFGSYVTHMMERTGRSRKEVVNGIGQYNKTKGIVNDILSKYLKKDENIIVKEEDVLVTVGAQEAFSIIVSTICNRENDVILAEDPGYIGVSSFAKVFDYNIKGIRADEDGIDIKELKNKIIEINRSGKKVKLLYVIPDYQNPSGFCMPIGNRIQLLEMAQQYNFLIIEDSVYNSFTYAQKKNPTLKSLDKFNKVIYVGSFSKSLFPGLRLGLIAAGQLIEDENGDIVALADEMAKVKAQLTNNTSTINQAILGGILLDQDYSLNDFSKPKFDSYKVKRNKMVDSLNKFIRYEDWAEGISWNEPDGGFFIKMCLPFVVDNELVYESASKYNVIFCPMSNFYKNGGGENEIRLTFSNVSLNDIETGVRQLALFLKANIVGEQLDYTHNQVLNY